MRRDEGFSEKKSEQGEPEIAIAVLDINKNETGFETYSNLPVKYKIIEMKRRIEHLCVDFEESEKDSK